MKKASRNLWLVTAIVTVLASIIIALVGCARSESTPQPASTISTPNNQVTELPPTNKSKEIATPVTTISRVDEEENYILFKSEGADTKRLSIIGDGRVEFIHFGGMKIIEYKTGTISQERFKQLVDLIEQIGFFEMDELYNNKAKEPGIPIDPQITSISVVIPEKEHTVAVTTDDYPGGFSQIIKELIEIVPTLEDQPSGIYIQAKKMDPRDVNVLKLNEVEINEFTEEQLTLLPALQKVIFEPGRFVYVNKGQEKNILQYKIETGFFHDHFYVNYAKQYYDISVLEKPK